MPERLVVTAAVAQRLLQLAQCPKEPMMGRPAPHHLPEALDQLQVWALARPPRPLDRRPLLEHLGNQGTPVPGGVVTHQDDPRVLGGRIRPRTIAHVARTPFLHAPLPRRGLLPLSRGPGPLDQASGQRPGDAVERPEDLDQLMTVQVTDDGAVPCEAQRRPQRGDHREACLILTQQHQLPRGGFC
jgi:hypothetical protein